MEESARDLHGLGFDSLAGLDDGGTSHHERAAGTGARPPGRDRRIAMNHLYILERDPQRIRGNLGKGGLHPLAVGGRPREHSHLAGGVDPHCGTFIARPCTQGTGGAKTGGINRGRDADTHEAPLLPQTLLLRPQPLVLREVERFGKDRLVVTAIILPTRGSLIGKRIRGNEILPSHLDRVHF